MRITRRYILGLMGSDLLSRVFAATVPAMRGQVAFDVDRLLESSRERGHADCRAGYRKYIASATVMLFSIPLVSRSGVGSGYAVVEEAGSGAGHTLSIQFGAGSYPERARGLNRLGFIQEAVVEERPGEPAECAWLAFMTTSKEASLDQAKKALYASGAVVPYSASQGVGRYGRFASRVDRLEFPSRYTWRDISQLVENARGAMAAGAGAEQQQSGSEKPATFLYQVRRAMLDRKPRTASDLVFNAKQFRLETQKADDAAATALFTEKQLVPSAGRVMRMDDLLTEERTSVKTPFRLWYTKGAEQSPPLRFEYQAKSFLRLTFEAAAAADTPAIRLAFKTTLTIRTGEDALKQSRVHFFWQKNSSSQFRTGVSLHSHTFHSRESMDFIERAIAHTPWLSGAMRKQRARYRSLKGGRELDLRRAWWTPPLSPRQAWDLERSQIGCVLGLDAIVSISDHDTIEGCLNLQVLEETHGCPISIEWTVPFR